MRFTVSARGKPMQRSVLELLETELKRITLAQVESVFGFVEPCVLYGGRPFVRPELSPSDVSALAAHGIGVRLPLSNHFVERHDYEASRGLLDKYHRPGNSVIIANDDLATWVRRDYPGFEIEASVIKNIHTHEAIVAALELYDTIVLPMSCNNDREFLSGIEAKARITLFANGGCALTCPAKLCYASFSKLNKGEATEIRCSFQDKPREVLGVVDFDVLGLSEMGFNRFKLLRPRPDGLTGF